MRTFLAIAVVAACCGHLAAAPAAPAPAPAANNKAQYDKENVHKWTNKVRETLNKWAQAGMDDKILKQELEPIKHTFPTDVSYQFTRNGVVSHAGTGYDAINFFIDQLRQIHAEEGIKKVNPGFPDPAFDFDAWEIIDGNGKDRDLLISAKFDGDRLYSYNLFYNW